MRKVQGKKQKPDKPYRIDWNDFAETVFEKLIIISQRNFIELCIHVEKKQSVLPIKRKHLEYILVELVDNAIKFSEKHTEINLHILNTGDILSVKVIDQGIGIPPEILPRIFNKFYQYKPCLNRLPGAGLGLSIVKGITKIYGGGINVKSQPGVGTEVEVTFCT